MFLGGLPPAVVRNPHLSFDRIGGGWGSVCATGRRTHNGRPRSFGQTARSLCSDCTNLDAFPRTIEAKYKRDHWDVRNAESGVQIQLY